MIDPVRSCEMPSCSVAIDLAEIRPGGLPRLARDFDQLSSGGHCFGSSRTRGITGGKITKFKLGHPVLTVAYDGAFFPNVSVRKA